MRKWINGYEGLYEICSEGNVYRHNKSGNIKQLKPIQNKSGYLTVNLSKEGKAKIKLVHRIVAEHFIDNPNNLPIVDHIDEDKTNNKVSNLRWCTGIQNVHYYNTKDGRNYHIQLGIKRKEQLKKYSFRLQGQGKELKQVKKELLAKEKELINLHKELLAKEELIIKQKEALDEYAKQLGSTSNNYAGYAVTKGIKFESVDDLVAATGKRVKVNGVVYKSCKAAAEYIVTEELKLGNVRTKATIDKELRRFLQGLRPAWAMYGRYTVENA